MSGWFWVAWGALWGIAVLAISAGSRLIARAAACREPAPLSFVNVEQTMLRTQCPHVLHRCAALEREIYGEVRSASAAEHVLHCPVAPLLYVNSAIIERDWRG